MNSSLPHHRAVPPHLPHPSQKDLPRSGPPPLPEARLAALQPARRSPPPLPKQFTSASPSPANTAAKAAPSLEDSNTNGEQSESAPNAVNRKKGLAFALVVSIIGLVLVGAGFSGYTSYRERITLKKESEQNHLRTAQQIREANEASIKAKSELDRLQSTIAENARVQAARTAVALVAPNSESTRVIPSASMAGNSSSKSLALLDEVPPSESDRRKGILKVLERGDLASAAKLDNMPAIRVLTASGIEASSVEQTIRAVQNAALHTGDKSALENMLAQLDSLPKPTRGDRKAARAANEEGLRMMQGQRFKEAVTVFNNALENDPADVEILGNLSLAYLKDGQLEEALKLSRYSVRISPRRAGAWNQIGNVYAQRGADWLAIRAYLTLYALSGDQAKTREFLARAAVESTDEKVRGAVESAITALPPLVPS